MAMSWTQGLQRVAIGWGIGLLIAWPVHANDGSFAVRVRVRTAPALPAAHLDAIPLPAGARRLTRSPEGDSYWFEGPVDVAAAHFHRAMPSRGYRLLQARGGTATWADASHRFEVRLQPVLGATPATRIVLLP